jgi:selenocysteine-specific elongation factor
MPQTHEHLAILQLLGITDGIVAITKIDRVDADRVAAVAEATSALAQGNGVRLHAVVPTSTVTGAGIDALRNHIASAAHSHQAAAVQGQFRLAIDRTFVIKGSGVVVTGTVHSGTLTQGGDVVIAPSGATARARTIRVSDRPAEQAGPGDRCAVNLAGIALDQVDRGDWLVAPGTFAPTRNVQVRLVVLDDFPRSVKHWLPVHVYHATSHAEGHVALLDSAPLLAGETGLVELVLASPLHPKHGDRLVLRDHALERTVGGGTVVDIHAPAKGRRAPLRLAQLKIQERSDGLAAFNQLMELDDVDIDAFKRGRNLTDGELDSVLAAATPQRLERDGRSYAVPLERWRAGLTALATQIAAYHKAAPHSPGLKADQLRRLALVPKRWLDAALAELVATGRIREAGGHFFEPGHRPQLPPEDAALLKRIEALIGTDEQPPSSGDIAKSLGIGLRAIDTFVGRMAKLGLLVRVGSNRVLLPIRFDALAELARKLADTHPDGFSARDFRDAAAIGRNLAIDVLEHFDHCGYTRRYGDLRRIVGAASTLKRA